jgi:hypothetical protein
MRRTRDRGCCRERLGTSSPARGEVPAVAQGTAVCTRFHLRPATTVGVLRGRQRESCGVLIPVSDFLAGTSLPTHSWPLLRVTRSVSFCDARNRSLHRIFPDT